MTIKEIAVNAMNEGWASRLDECTVILIKEMLSFVFGTPRICV